MADCPTCGSPVTVISSDEGTSYYEPAFRPAIRSEVRGDDMDDTRTAELAALERLAVEASPGPWAAEAPSRDKATLAWIVRERQAGPQVANILLDADAAYIAAVSPDVVLRLIEQLRAAFRPAVGPSDETAAIAHDQAWQSGYAAGRAASHPAGSTPDFMAADRALAVAHRADDQPCGCDECMSYGAEDSGFDWYRVCPARRIVLRVLDSGDARLAAIATAFSEHEAALAADKEDPADD